MDDMNAMPFSWPTQNELSTTTEGSTVDNIISTIKNIVETAATDQIASTTDQIVAAPSNTDNPLSAFTASDSLASFSNAMSSRFADTTASSTETHSATTFHNFVDDLFNFSIDAQQTVSKVANDIKGSIPSSTVAASTTGSEISSEGTTENVLTTIADDATTMIHESIATILGNPEAPTEHSTIFISSTANPSAGPEEFTSSVSPTINNILNSTVEATTNSGLIEESLNTTMSTLNIDDNMNSTISEVVTNTPVVNSTSSIITELFTSEITSTSDSSIFTSGNTSEVTSFTTTVQPEVSETTTMQIITTTIEHSVKMEDDDHSSIYIIVGSVLLLLIVLIIGMVFVYKRYNHKLSLRSGDYCVNQLKEVKTHKGVKNNDSPAAKDCSNTRF